MEMSVESHCGVVMFGVVGLTLLLASVKLMGMWVLTTLLRDALGVLDLWLKYLYQKACKSLIPCTPSNYRRESL